MLNEEEKKFIVQWEKDRVKFSTVKSKFLRGLPMAMIFSFPIFFSVIMVYFFSPEWYTKVSQNIAGSILVVVLAVMIIILFFSFFRMHFKWEMNEQLFEELKQKEKINKS